MARKTRSVTVHARDPHRIPDALGEGAVLLETLSARGMLTALGERLQIRRQGGYCGLDIMVFLLLFFSAGQAGGLQQFWTIAQPVHKDLAALAGRRSLPSPSSISRALGAVQNNLIRPYIGWLLRTLPETLSLLRHSAVCHLDARS